MPPLKQRESKRAYLIKKKISDAKQSLKVNNESIESQSIELKQKQQETQHGFSR